MKLNDETNENYESAAIDTTQQPSSATTTAAASATTAAINKPSATRSKDHQTQGDTLNEIKAMRRRHSRSVNVSTSM